MKDFRTRIWVNPFQSSLFTRVLVYWAIYTVTLFNFLFIWKLLQEGPGDIFDQFSRTVLDNVPLFLSFLVVVPWIALDAVRFSNRLVGPLHRFRMSMQKITNGEPLQIIRLRKDDFLLDMQDDFNAMLEALESRGGVEIRKPQSAKPAETESQSR